MANNLLVIYCYNCARTEASGDWFDEAAAKQAVDFFGDWLSLPWQRETIRQLYGWKRRNGCRRYRYCFADYIARKNGKTPVFEECDDDILSWVD